MNRTPNMESKRSHQVLILHDRCGDNSEDYYLADCILALLEKGYRVSICSTEIEKHSVLNYSSCPMHNFRQYKITTVIPTSILGYLQYFCKKMRILATTMTAFKKIKPYFVLTDNDPFCLTVAKWLGNCKTILLPDIYEVLVSKRVNKQTIYRSTWLMRQFMKSVDELIIPTPVVEKLYRSNFPGLKISATVALPCYHDKGWRHQKTFSLVKYLPSLPVGHKLFVAIVNYNEECNIMTLLEAAADMLRVYKGEFCIQQHLIITGSKGRKENSHEYFKSLLKYSKGKIFERNVTFIWELSIYEQMYLMSYATAVLFPDTQGLHPGPMFMTMSLGIPVVAAKNFLTQYLIQSGQNGIVVANLAGIFAAVIHLLFENTEKCKFMSKNALLRYKQSYSFEIFETTICNMLKKYH